MKNFEKCAIIESKGYRDNMEQIINLVVQNGVGVGSFIALLYFMGTSLKDIRETTEEISKTLLLIQNNLNSLQARIETIENRVERTYEGKN